MDVAIVGGGPAGAWAGVKLARMGAKVTIFDPSHPREKPCGGGVTGRALQLVVGELGTMPFPCVAVRMARFERAMASPAEPAPPEHLDAATVSLTDRGLSPDTSLVIASRTEFDAALVKAAVEAGARLITDRVLDVDPSKVGATIRTRHATYSAGFLLGADGANSLVRRRVLAPFARHQISIGTGYFVHGVSSAEVVIRWTSNPPGYLWSFPRPNHLAVGICAQHTDEPIAKRLRELSGLWISAAGFARNAIRVAPYSWPIPTLSAQDLEHLPVAGDRWMLVGDAAGLVDPLTREGIYYALMSAELAAASIRSDRNPGMGYRARLIDNVLPELARASRLKAGFFTAGFSRLVVHALRESDAIRTVMRELLAGRQPYIGLRRRLLRTGRVDLAFRAISNWGLA